MLAGWFASRSARKRFQREIELAARFQHPGIVRVLESGPVTVNAGGQIVYTIASVVTGTEAADAVTIEDLTPLNTTFVSAQGALSIDHPPVGTSGIVRWHLGDLDPDSTGVVTLTVNVNSPQLR